MIKSCKHKTMCTAEFFSCLNFQKDWFSELVFIEKFHEMNFPFLKNEKLWIWSCHNTAISVRKHSKEELSEGRMWLSYKRDLCARGHD